jgi:K+-sensing histidine kinase KdpD
MLMPETASIEREPSPSTEGSFDEGLRLRHCLRDLLALSALPAIWTGYRRPDAVLESLSDALVGALRLDFIYTRLDALPQRDSVEVARMNGRRDAGWSAPELGRALAPCLELQQPGAPLSIPHPAGSGTVRITISPIGYAEGCGIVVAGSQRPDFPTECERLLLSFVANQAAIALNAARLAAERERAEAEQAQLLVRERAARAEAEAAQWRAGFLAEAGALLTSSLDFEATLRGVARLVVPTLADFCAVKVPDEERGTSLALAAHVDAAKEELVRRLQSLAPAAQPGPISEALRNGRSLLVPDYTDDLLEANAIDAERRALLRQLRPRSVIVVPLLARGRRVGVMLLGTAESGRRYGPADLDLAEDLARRVALAVDNAQLYRAAQRAVGVRDEILAATSHELRTPLGHIKGFVSTLRQPDVEWDEATRRDFLAETEREADRLARLVDDLLDMSRIESGGLDRSQRARVRPWALVAGALARVGDLAAAHRLEVAVPDDLPPVLADAAQLELVLKNLLENAAKYSSPGTRIRVSGARAGGEVRLAVEDEGLGIPPEHLERVFERFFRVTGAGLPAQPGTGLGLAISRGIVRAHGGRVWAENRPEGGARFVVALPAA